MSEPTPEAHLSMFSPEFLERNPDLRLFVEEVNQKVNEILDEAMSGYNSVEDMPEEKREELRKRLLGVRIVYSPEGEVKDD